MKRLLFSIAIGLVMSGTLSAYQVGKWDPLDRYIVGVDGAGPRKLIVTDSDGKVLQSAEYRYDSTGKLIEERYSDSDGKHNGNTHYFYKNGKLISEVLKSSSGTPLSEQKFSYDKGGNIIRIVITIEGKTAITQSYLYKKGVLIGGKEVSGKVTDPFRIEYAGDRITALKFYNPDGSVYSEIQYRYDRSGRLIQRNRITSAEENTCRYSYDANGRVASYQYFNQRNGTWEPGKKFHFEY